MILVDTDYFALETKSFIFSDFIINNTEGHKFLKFEAHSKCALIHFDTLQMHSILK